MRISRRVLLVAVIIGAGFSLILFPARLDIQAAGQSILRCQSQEVPGLDSKSHEDAEPSQDEADDNWVVIAAVAGPVALNARSVRVPFAPVGGSEAVGKTLASRVKMLGPDRRIHLVVRELSAEKQPDDLYEVYLDLPPGARPVGSDPHYVGTLNFFNAVTRSGSGSSRNDLFFSFDVTGLIRTLRARNMLSDKITVTIFAPGDPVADARPTVGRIELIEQ